MTGATRDNLVWWVFPDVLGGMPIPFVAPERRLKGGGARHEFDDDLPRLWKLGVRSVVCLLNIPSDEKVYRAAGFDFLCCPVLDYEPPSVAQVRAIARFIDRAPKATVVHCEGGLGRTGTVLAAYLILGGDRVATAVARVRVAEPAAIESASQMDFLQRLDEGVTLGTR